MSETSTLDAASDSIIPVRRTFMRVTEVWTPDATGERLTLASGLYGELDGFAAVSGTESFAFGEGLPGKAWAERRPVVLKGFRGSYFKRTEAAEAAGLTAGIALPIFAGEVLKGVVAFFFGDDAAHVGAVEVWGSDGRPGSVMALEDGYFGSAEHFAWISGHTRFPHGMGLPGTVLATRRAALFRDLGASYRFLRSESAAEAGITAGLGLPVPVPGADAPVRVVTLLSALGTPIARRFEIWNRSEDGTIALGDAIGEADAAARTQGSGPLARVAATGVPLAQPLQEGAGSVVALPIHANGAVVQIAAWYF